MAVEIAATIEVSPATREALAPDAVQGWGCPNCDAVIDTEPERDPVYECGNCGSVFSRSESDNEDHRCSCGKFASKVGDYTCEACSEPVESKDDWEEVLLLATTEGDYVVVE